MNTTGPLDSKIYYRDIALIRESIPTEDLANFDGHFTNILRVVNENGFINTILKTRATHEYWHQVMYV